ncbi:IDEAL domain-containing protein [Thalassobacillus cyri]|uniref:IDEAL domain-containing protein n=1 Tax=Thalassobacillus cyri TaxID=571932 RepID=A0A1H4ASS8_9BACI|nr:IDEAL domain-containing protein [Thalassobacillus cyri]SEA38906.1 IDEAL domain-containing protein [Thalassobacillus cyri]
MLSIKMLKPYYVKEDERFVRVVLAYQYFSLYVDGELYHFVPLEAKEIIIDRKKQKVHNVFDIFVFQRGKKMIYVAVTDLLQLPDFLTHLNSIVDPYLKEKSKFKVDKQNKNDEALEGLFEQLEQLNFNRMIDRALDNRDRETFYDLLGKKNFV